MGIGGTLLSAALWSGALHATEAPPGRGGAAVRLELAAGLGYWRPANSIGTELAIQAGELRWHHPGAAGGAWILPAGAGVGAYRESLGGIHLSYRSMLRTESSGYPQDDLSTSWLSHSASMRLQSADVHLRRRIVARRALLEVGAGGRMMWLDSSLQANGSGADGCWLLLTSSRTSQRGRGVSASASALHKRGAAPLRLYAQGGGSVVWAAEEVTASTEARGGCADPSADVDVQGRSTGGASRRAVVHGLHAEVGVELMTGARSGLRGGIVVEGLRSSPAKLTEIGVLFPGIEAEYQVFQGVEVLSLGVILSAHTEQPLSGR